MIRNNARWIYLATSAVEIVGTAISSWGFGTRAAFLLGLARDKTGRATPVADFHSGLGRSILLGLEFLIAADITDIVAVEPTNERLLALARIVLIKFLSFSLEVKIDGRRPCQKGRSNEGAFRGTGQQRWRGPSSLSQDGPIAAIPGIKRPAPSLPIVSSRFQRRSGR